MAAYWAYFKEDFEPELNTITGEIDTVSTTTEEYKTAAEAAQAAAELAETNAETAQSAAETARDAAANYANSTIYAAGTTYDAGDIVLDPGDSYKPYISQQAANTGNTPNTDDGTWWVAGLTEAVVAGMTLLATATAAGDATVDFTSGIDSTYDEYEIHINSLFSSADGDNFRCRTSANGGSTWDSGASDYMYSYRTQDYPAGDSADAASNGNDYFTLPPSNLDSTTSTGGANVTIRLCDPSNAGSYTHMYYSGIYIDNNGNPQSFYGGGIVKLASIVNGIRFYFSTGNVAAGEFKLYGIKKSI
jgi:hypothetical protein